MSDSEPTVSGADRPIAIITGASSGLGAEFAREFAARGHDLLLVARRRKRLEIMAAEAAVKYGVTAEIMPADLSLPEDLERVAARIGETGQVRAFVHSAGFGLEGPFAGSDVAQQVSMINVHVLAGVRLTRAALPAMVQRGQGSVILVSSLGAFAPLPGFATYGATKAYMVSFVRSLAIELEGTGVRVQALCPGFTRTEFQDRQGADLTLVPKIMWSTPAQVVASSLRALDADRVVFVPGLLNRVAAKLAGPFGGYIQRRIAAEHGWTTQHEDALASDDAAARRPQ